MKHYTEIVPFELAVKLKDAEYPQIFGNGAYSEYGSYFSLISKENLVIPFISAPTYAEVFDWLMGKDLFVYVRGCIVDVWDDRNQREYSSEGTALVTWEQLAQIGIVQALEILEDRK